MILRKKDYASKVDELLTYAEAAYIHLLADKLHTEYAYFKRNVSENKEKLIELVKQSRESAVDLIRLVRKNAHIGYEASNHYFYTANILKEKLINCDNLIAELSSK